MPLKKSLTGKPFFTLPFVATSLFGGDAVHFSVRHGKCIENRNTEYPHPSAIRRDVSYEGILLSFEKGVAPDIKRLEQAYGLKYRRTLAVGLLYFSNISKKPSQEILDTIIANEKGLDTAKVDAPTIEIQR